MGYSVESIQHNDPKNQRRPVRVFRYVKEQKPQRAWRNSPFTEMPEELKQDSPRFVHALQEAFNTLLLLTLALALIVLVAAFAYQLIYAPEVLVTWSQNLVNALTSFLQQIIPTPAA